MLVVVLRCILMPEEENAGPTVPLRTITKIAVLTGFLGGLLGVAVFVFFVRKQTWSGAQMDIS